MTIEDIIGDDTGGLTRFIKDTDRMYRQAEEKMPSEYEGEVILKLLEELSLCPNVTKTVYQS